MKRIALFLLCPFMTWAMEQKSMDKDFDLEKGLITSKPCHGADILKDRRQPAETLRSMNESSSFLDRMAIVHRAGTELGFNALKLDRCKYCSVPTYMQTHGLAYLCIGALCGWAGVTKCAILYCLCGGCEISCSCYERFRDGKG